MTNQEITQTINALVAEYKTASPDRQAAIQQEITPLYKQLPLRVGYCYNCNMRRALPDGDPHWNFCGAACHDEWANREYGQSKFHHKRPSVADMKRELQRMAREEHVKRLPNGQQQLIVE